MSKTIFRMRRSIGYLKFTKLDLFSKVGLLLNVAQHFIKPGRDISNLFSHSGSTVLNEFTLRQVYYVVLNGRQVLYQSLDIKNRDTDIPQSQHQENDHQNSRPD